MQNIDVVKTLPKSYSYNYKWVVDRYDLAPDTYKKEWKFSFEFPEQWSIGLIVGNSGSGKSVIAKEIFKVVYQGEIIQKKNVPLVEALGDKPMSDISNALVSVGLGSVPEWITPYAHLSTGQKMRADLAWCILSDATEIVYDEFTSVVDRQIARVLSYSIGKAFARSNKKFVAVTCHHDVEEWLEPDWVLNMDMQTFSTGKKKGQTSQCRFTRVTRMHGSYLKTITI